MTITIFVFLYYLPLTLALSLLSKAGLVFLAACEYTGSLGIALTDGCSTRGNIVGTASGFNLLHFFIHSFCAMNVSVSKQSSVKWSLQTNEYGVGPLHPSRVLRTCLVQRSLKTGSRS